MKILKLTFENISALKGKWQIDFSNEAFAANTLFAITGATGAGKTSVLDAICLALYAETPRLKISPNHNELMSIGTTHASSEVIVKVNEKIYRVSWQQRRANQKSDGKLQAVKRELAELCHIDDEQGVILEEKASLVNKRIEEILGMTMVQFTRSVMLVQGDFAAFLQSESEQRGEILEQITGTQIYAQIGKAAHEKHKSQKDLLKELNTKLGEVQLLDKAEFDKLSQDLSAADSEKQQLDDKLNRHEKMLSVATLYHDTLAQINQSQQQIQITKAKLDDFATQQTRLDLGKQAQQLSGSYQKYTTLLEEEKVKNQQIINSSHQLDELKISQQDSHQQKQQAQQTLQQATSDYEQQKPIIAQARRLDADNAVAQQSVLHLENQQRQQRSQQQNTIKQLSQLQQMQQNITTDLQAILNQSTHQNTDDILEKINNIKLKRTQIQDACASIQSFSHKLHDKRAQLLENITQSEQLRCDYRQLKDTLATQRRQLDDLVATLNKCLKSSVDAADVTLAIEQFRTAIAALQTGDEQHKRQLLQKLSDDFYQHQNQLDDITAQRHAIEQNQAKLNELHQEKASINQQLDTQKQQHELHLKNFELQQHIRHLQALFDELQADTPCPLCGATDHPYKQHERPPHHADDDSEQALKNSQNHLEQLSQTLAKLEQQISALQAMIDTQQGQLQKSRDAADRLFAQIIEQWQQHAQTPLNAHALTQAIADLDTLIAWQQKQSQYAQSQLQTLESLHQQHRADTLQQQHLLQLGQDRSRNTQQQLTQIDEICQAISQQVTQVVNYQEILNNLGENSTFATLGDALRIQLQMLLDNHQQLVVPMTDLKKLGVQHIGALSFFEENIAQQYLHSLQNWQDQLMQQYQQQQKIIEQKQQLESKNIEIQAKINTLTEQQNQHDEQLSQLHLELQKAQSEQQAIHQKRSQLLGDVDIDHLETELQKNISNAQQALDEQEKVYQDNQEKLHKMTAALTQDKAYLAQLQTKLSAADKEFHDKLSQSSFADSDALLAAMIDDDTLAQLQSQADALNAEYTQATLTLQNSEQKRAQLASEHPDIAGSDPQLLTQALQSLRQEQTLLNQKIGKLITKHEHELTNREHQATLLAQIEQQNKDNEIWAKLDLLIGSADGKKYRNFVQGLTLDLVLSHANQILQKMSDRYLLAHDSNSPKALEILVTDIHQGSVTRSSKNLSGGETFIISLALALGLSQINSRKVPIESLFLDEGFGTLDENALDVALSTLFELQQSGKSIGIISHVASLKERIDTQIVVTKHAGGVSTLSGAGVKKL